MLNKLKNLKRMKINTISGILGVVLYFTIPLISVSIYGHSIITYGENYFLYVIGGIILLSLIIEMLDHSGRLRLWNSGLYIGLYVYFIIVTPVVITVNAMNDQDYDIYNLIRIINGVAGWLIIFSLAIAVYVLINFVSSGTYLSKSSKTARGGVAKARIAIAMSRLGRR